MAEIVQRACAGTMESSDVYVEIESGREGIQLRLESVVRQQFGEAIRETVRAVLAELGVENALVEIQDYGCLDFAIRARLKTAVRRARRSEHG